MVSHRALWRHARDEALLALLNEDTAAAGASARHAQRACAAAAQQQPPCVGAARGAREALRIRGRHKGSAARDGVANSR
jgi:hypothetical protein